MPTHRSARQHPRLAAFVKHHIAKVLANLERQDRVSVLHRPRGRERPEPASPGAYTVTCSASWLNGERSIARLTAPTSIME